MRSGERARPLLQDIHLGLSPAARFAYHNMLTRRDALLQSRLIGPAITTGLALVIYLLTVAPGLTWANYGGDGGELITASATLGIPHPPGYPIYLLVGKIVALVPIGSVAYRFNLLSAIALALAAGLLTATVDRLLRKNQSTGSGYSRFVPVATGLTFALIPLVWGQALIAEVYTLNLFLLSLLLWLLVHEIDKKKAIVAGIVFGLSITTHLTSVFFLPLSLYLLPRRYWPKFALGSLFGVLPFLVFPILAAGSSSIIWGKNDTLSGWLWFITARIYRPNVLSLARADWWPRLAEWGSLFIRQLAWFAIPLIILGYLSAKSQSRRLMIALTVSIALYAVYSFGYRSSDAIVFLLPGILLLAVTLGFGMKSLGIASLLLPAMLLGLNFGRQYIGDDVGVRTAAVGALQALPDDAIVITPGDQSESTLLYYQQIEGFRPDLIIVDDTMFQFDWYRERLKTRYPALVNIQHDDVPGFIESNLSRHAVCRVGLVSSSTVECVSSPGALDNSNP
jgi:hypothetical protein